MGHAWAQWTMLAIFVINLICAAILDGKGKKGSWSFRLCVANIAAEVFLLWFAGAFSHIWGTP